jgi:hypothetical protein
MEACWYNKEIMEDFFARAKELGRFGDSRQILLFLLFLLRALKKFTFSPNIKITTYVLFSVVYK